MDRVTAEQIRKDTMKAKQAEILREAEKFRQQRIDRREEMVMGSDLKKEEEDYKAAIDSKDPLRIAQAKSALANAAQSQAAIKTPEERQADLDAVKALTKERNAAAAKAGREKGLTTEQQIKLSERMQAVTAALMAKEEGDKAVTWEEKKSIMAQENQSPLSVVYYADQVDPNDGGWFGAAQPGKYTAITLPIDPSTGKQITAADIQETAIANKTTPRNILIRMKLIKE